jgi:exopolysaccharide production protein ExoY
MAGLVDTRDRLHFTSVPESRPVGSGLKRTMDVLLALSGIVLLAPLLLLCFLAVALTSPGPALFRHRRVGFGGKPFYCLKFRTMAIDAPERLRLLIESDAAAAAEWASSCKLRCDPRITPIGNLLRKSSLDELPQLFNVLKGEMSMVGPRPVTEDELIRYSDAVSAYMTCRPGITGLWQVSGRSTTTYSRRVACDAFYAKNWTIALDTKILIITIPSLLLRDSAY